MKKSQIKNHKESQIVSLINIFGMFKFFNKIGA